MRPGEIRCGMSSWTPGTVDYCRDGGLLLPLQRRAEAKTTYGGDHLLDGDLGGVEGHDRFLRLEAYVRPIHDLQPFQGLLDRDGQAPHVIPSTARTTVEVAAIPTFTAITRPSNKARTDAQRFIAFSPCRDRCEGHRCSSDARAGRT